MSENKKSFVELVETYQGSKLEFDEVNAVLATACVNYYLALLVKAKMLRLARALGELIDAPNEVSLPSLTFELVYNVREGAGIYMKQRNAPTLPLARAVIFFRMNEDGMLNEIKEVYVYMH